MDSTRVTIDDAGIYYLHVPGKSDLALSKDEFLELFEAMRDEADEILGDDKTAESA